MTTKYEDMVAEASEDENAGDEDQPGALDADQLPETGESNAEDEDAEQGGGEAPNLPEAPDEEQPAAVGLTPEQIAKAERARGQYRTKLAGILGDEAVAHECVLCAGLGYLGDLPPEGTEFVFHYTAEGPELGFKPPEARPEYQQASDKETCPECAGYGVTLTGAKPPAQVEWQCGKCGGAGWVTKTPTAGANVQPLYLSPSEAPPQADAGSGMAPDAWGRPWGHAHYGVPPAAIQG